MNYLDKNTPNPLDRLGLLLDHASAMALAATGEEFPTMNAKAILNFNDALSIILIDARSAFDDIVEAHINTHLQKQQEQRGAMQ